MIFHYFFIIHKNNAEAHDFFDSSENIPQLAFPFWTQDTINVGNMEKNSIPVRWSGDFEKYVYKQI